GISILGEAAGDQFGYSCSLSADGSLLAVGADYNDGANGVDSGSVRVYAWNGAAWVRRGEDLDGEAAGDGFGRGLSLSGDGQRLAIGAPINVGPDGASSGSMRGSTSVFTWTGTTWSQRGDDIVGKAAGERFGRAVALNYWGNILVSGGWGADSLTGTVRAYDWVFDPTGQPTGQPSSQPSLQPFGQPTGQPSSQPSTQPTMQPFHQPTSHPTSQPSSQPTWQPTSQPLLTPTCHPSSQPSSQPSKQPTGQPSGVPSAQPTNQPSCPTSQPSTEPTRPTTQPTSQPSLGPSFYRTSAPTSPSGQPSGIPSTQPSSQPSSAPTSQPSGHPFQ
ncbi:hypothetical protein EON64_18455, partial [archaeon]